MEEAQAAAAESPTNPNIIYLVLTAIIVILGGLLVREHIMLGETVKAVAAFYAKCP